MFLRFLFLVSALAVCGATNGQVQKKIKKGRRNKSESRFALAQDDFQVDWEIGYEKVSDELSTIIYPNLFLHYGISNRVEVNVETTLLTLKDHTMMPKTNSTGIEPVQVGISYVVNKETAKGPAVIASLQLAIPFLATNYFKADHLAPTFQVDVQLPLGEKFVAGLTPGIFLDGFTTSPYFTYNATFSYAFAKKWMATSEFFGFAGPDIPQYNLDGQLTYIFNNQLQVGCTLGTGLSNASHKGYVSVSGSYGFSMRRKKVISN